MEAVISFNTPFLETTNLIDRQWQNWMAIYEETLWDSEDS